MSYQITGTLITRSETRQATDTFKVRDFGIKVVEDSKYENFASFQLTQERCSLVDDLKKGEEITVHFDLRGRLKDGKIYTNLNAWKIERAGQPAANAAPSFPKAPPAPATAPANDDLPF